jgi:hypothetical protein
MMSERDAVKLANLIAAYIADSVAEGATEDEALDYNLRDTLADIVSTTPAYHLLDLSDHAKRLTD